MKKILIIDDEEDIVTFTQMALEAKGYHLIPAYDGISGLEKAQKEIPDLILLDVMMPGLDGFEVCERLKTDDKYKHIPVIMLSAKVHAMDQNRGKEVGCDDYVIKPFEMKELLIKIREYMKE